MAWKNGGWLTLFCHWFGSQRSEDRWWEVSEPLPGGQMGSWKMMKPCSPAIVWLWSLLAGFPAPSKPQSVQWPFNLRSNWIVVFFFFSFLQILLQSSCLLLVLSTCFSYHFYLEIKSVPWYGILLTLLILPWPTKYIFGLNWFQGIIS